MLIRGFGLKSANDEPNRDPKNFSFMVLDALDGRDRYDRDY